MEPGAYNTEGAGSVLSGVSTGVNAPQALGGSKRKMNDGREPVHQTTNKVIPPGKLRQASPEAIALMMANKEKHDKMSNSVHWVPGGPPKEKKLFY